MKLVLLLIFIMLAQGCVKDESNIGSANTDSPSGSTGGTSGSTGSGSNGSTGTDPLAAQAWHLKNTGIQSAYSLDTGKDKEDINVESVHTVLNIRGRNVRIAVSDTGTDIDHKDLAGNVIAGEHRNYTPINPTLWRNANPYPGDENHGTGVAGLIAALGWNGIGSRGVAPLAKFASFKYLVSPLAGETTSSRLAKQIDQMDGNFDIFNYSYGKTGYLFVEEEDIVKNALKLGVTNLRNGKGALYVQSSGNSYEESFLVCADETDPACVEKALGNTNAHETLATPYKIVVGATTALGKLTSYSTPGSSIWVSAPGGEDGLLLPAMITTDISGCNMGMSYWEEDLAAFFDFGYHPMNKNCDYTNRFNGTSSAAPVVSGVIALMLEANPNLTWRDVKHILAKTSYRIDYDSTMNELPHPLGKDVGEYVYDKKWTKNKANYWFSNYYGFGRVNAHAAVTMAMSYSPSTLGPYEELTFDSGPLSGIAIPDNSDQGVEHKIWVPRNYTVESVQIEFTSDHPWPGEVAIHLVSPLGTESRLLNINSNIYALSGFEADTLMLTNAFYGEKSEGYWTIKLYDGDSAAGTGLLTNWKLKINGHLDSTEVLKPRPVSNIYLGPTPVSSSMSPVYSFTHSPDLPTILYYEVAVGTTAETEDVRGWTNIGLVDYGNRFTGLSLVDEQTYFIKIRAVNIYGASSVEIISWKADF